MPLGQLKNTLNASLPRENSWTPQNQEGVGFFDSYGLLRECSKIQIGTLGAPPRRAVYQRDTTEVALAGADAGAGNKAAA